MLRSEQVPHSWKSGKMFQNTELSGLNLELLLTSLEELEVWSSSWQISHSRIDTSKTLDSNDTFLCVRVFVCWLVVYIWPCLYIWASLKKNTLLNLSHLKQLSTNSSGGFQNKSCLMKIHFCFMLFPTRGTRTVSPSISCNTWLIIVVYWRQFHLFIYWKTWYRLFF